MLKLYKFAIIYNSMHKSILAPALDQYEAWRNVEKDYPGCEIISYKLLD